MKVSSRAVWAGVGWVSLASVGAALFAQHRLDMQPCPWCILQRMLFIGIGLSGLLAAVVPPRHDGSAGVAERLLAAVTALLALGGVSAALYQHLVAAKSSSCAMTLADRIISGSGLDALWPDVFEVRASCAEAAVSVLGVPFELWSLGLFAVLGAAALRRLFGDKA